MFGLWNQRRSDSAQPLIIGDPKNAFANADVLGAEVGGFQSCGGSLFFDQCILARYVFLVMADFSRALHPGKYGSAGTESVNMTFSSTISVMVD